MLSVFQDTTDFILHGEENLHIFAFAVFLTNNNVYIFILIQT